MQLAPNPKIIVYKDALVVELSRAGIPFLREKNYEITYKGVILPHYYYADFVVWDKILFEAKAVEKLTDSHIKQVLNYLAASKLRLGLLVNFWWRFAGMEKDCLMRREFHEFTLLASNAESDCLNIGDNSCNSCL